MQQYSSGGAIPSDIDDIACFVFCASGSNVRYAHVEAGSRRISLPIRDGQKLDQPAAVYP